MIKLQAQAGNAAVASIVPQLGRGPVRLQRDNPKTPAASKGEKGAGTEAPEPMSEDIKKLGPAGIPHAVERVRDAAEAVFESAANGLAAFKETQEFKDVERPSWDRELVIAIAGLALGGFVSSLMELHLKPGAGHIREAMATAWEKGFEAAGDEATKRAFADTLPEKTYPVVAFMQGQRQILLDLKKKARDNFDNNTSPALHRKALEDPKSVPAVLDELQGMIVDYDKKAQTAGSEQFRRTLDAWNVYMAKVALIPAKEKREKRETPLNELVSGGAPMLDFPPGVLRIECNVAPGFKHYSNWRFGLGGLNESLRSSFHGRLVNDVHVPKVAVIHLTEPATSLTIGRNEGGGFYLDAPSSLRWALYELAVPDWKQRAQDVKEGRERAHPMETDVWQGARMVMEDFIGAKSIEDVAKLAD